MSLLLSAPYIKVNRRTPKGDTAITLAAGAGQVNAVLQLLHIPYIDVGNPFPETLVAKPAADASFSAPASKAAAKKPGKHPGSAGHVQISSGGVDLMFLDHGASHGDSGDSP